MNGLLLRFDSSQLLKNVSLLWMLRLCDFTLGCAESGEVLVEKEYMESWLELGMLKSRNKERNDIPVG